eukprot:TRINITY_DN2711_c0_g3_i1.p3 TRINITY_DN2711_c0_g3~~TRINITY_DN2711_c0_g3_i1.p3  ORF type:complete len:112 (+),score=2.89 TRINITY_DN2711_c0_g3_i1:408-743(+)
MTWKFLRRKNLVIEKIVTLILVRGQKLSDQNVPKLFSPYWPTFDRFKTIKPLPLSKETTTKTQSRTYINLLQQVNIIIHSSKDNFKYYLFDHKNPDTTLNQKYYSKHTKTK